MCSTLIKRNYDWFRKPFIADPTEMLRDIMISEAFVHMSVEMIGHYENHFVEVSDNMTFQVSFKFSVVNYIVTFFHFIQLIKT